MYRNSKPPSCERVGPDQLRPEFINCVGSRSRQLDCGRQSADLRSYSACCSSWSASTLVLVMKFSAPHAKIWRRYWFGRVTPTCPLGWLLSGWIRITRPVCFVMFSDTGVVANIPRTTKQRRKRRQHQRLQDTRSPQCAWTHTAQTASWWRSIVVTFNTMTSDTDFRTDRPSECLQRSPRPGLWVAYL